MCTERRGLTKSSRKKFVFVLLLIGMFFGFAALLAEVVIRIAEPAGLSRPMVSRELTYDAVLGWKGKPGFDESTGPGRVRISINNHGFRDGDWDEKLRRAEREGRQKVLFIGDSLTFGYRIPDADRVSEQLAGLFDLLDSPIETFNAGMSAYGTGQEFRTLELLIPLIQPDTVVVRYCENDIGDSMLPYDYRLSNRVYKPFFNLDGRLVMHQHVPRRFSHIVENTWLNHLRARFLVDRVQYAIDGARFRKHIHLWNSPLLDMRPRLSRRMKKLIIGNLGAISRSETLRPIYDINKRRNLALWRRMDSLCRKNGAHMIFLADVQQTRSQERELLDELTATQIDVINSSDALLQFRPWAAVLGDGHPNFVDNYVCAVVLFNRLTDARQATDFSQTAWLRRIPTEVELNRPHPRSILFGTWGKMGKHGRRGQNNALLLLANQYTNRTGQVSVKAQRADKPQSPIADPVTSAEKEATIKLFVAGELRAVYEMKDDVEFVFGAKLRPNDLPLLLLKIESDVPVWVRSAQVRGPE